MFEPWEGLRERGTVGSVSAPVWPFRREGEREKISMSAQMFVVGKAKRRRSTTVI